MGFCIFVVNAFFHKFFLFFVLQLTPPGLPPGAFFYPCRPVLSLLGPNFHVFNRFTPLLGSLAPH